ncbi:MAG TPA: flagellar filament capping protein FliD [archaeon]|nr:flagellar filament capping protein FliD [archaeon]
MTSPISFTGLASGIDTESIITQLLDIQRRPIERLQNKTQTLSLNREALRDVNNQLLSLQKEALNLRLESTFSSRTVTSSDDSKIRATAAFSAAKTTHRVKVFDLAQEATVTSHRYTSQARLLGSNTSGINLLGGANYNNAPGAGRIKGGVTLNPDDTLANLGLTSDFTLKIDPDAGGSRSPIQITGLQASTTVSELIGKIKAQVDTVKAQLTYDEVSGEKVMQLASDYVGVDLSLSGAVAEAVFGISSGATASSNSSSGLGSARATAALNPNQITTGTATIVSSNGRAGNVTGSVDLAAIAGGGNILALTLDDLGVTEFEGFTIDPDAGGATGSVTVLKEDGSSLTADDTVADLIGAINHSVPDVTAQLVEGPGGSVNLRITANAGGRDITASQLGTVNGIMKKVLGTDDTVTSSNATTDSADFTMVKSFYPRGSLAPVERRVVSGTKEDYRTYGVTDLIDGVTIVGATTGDVFTPGSARVQINNSEKLAIEENAKTQFFGVTGVTDSSYATGLALDRDSSGVIGLNKAIKDLVAAGAFALDDGTGVLAGTFRVGDSTLTITQEELDNGITVAEVLARINSSNEGIVLSYEPGTDRFMATASDYGSGTDIRFGIYSGIPGQSNILKVLGLTNAPKSVLTSAGTDAGRIDADSELVQAGFILKPTSGTFTINGITLEVDANSDSLNEIIEKINSSAAGVTATLDPTSNRISLVQKVDSDTTENYIRVGSSSDTSNLLRALRITGGANSDGTINNVESIKVRSTVGNQRTQADFEVDNIRYTRNSNSIDDVTPGLTYELVGVSETPVTISVTGDTEKAVDAIARFVVEYNKTLKLINPPRLETSERKYLEPITDEERSKLSYEELLDRLDKYETYNKNETIRRESNIQLLEGQLRTAIFSQVNISGSTLTSLADLGISSGPPGAPLTTNYEGVLVADSTDFDEIKEALQNNSALTEALEKDDYSVYRLFGQTAISNVSLKGTTAFNEATPLANDITFQIFNGTKSATITLPAGSMSRTDVLSAISNQLTLNDINDIKVSFDASGHLQFQSEKTTGRAFIRILDATGASETDRLSTRFGINSGSFLGEEAETRAGVGEKLYAQLRQTTGVSGFLSQRTSFGGIYGQGTIFDELVATQEQIMRLEERLTQREENLRKRFANMEQIIARLNEQQNSLSQYLNAINGTSTNG